MFKLLSNLFSGAAHASFNTVCTMPNQQLWFLGFWWFGNCCNQRLLNTALLLPSFCCNSLLARRTYGADLKFGSGTFGLPSLISLYNHKIMPRECVERSGGAEWTPSLALNKNWISLAKPMKHPSLQPQEKLLCKLMPRQTPCLWTNIATSSKRFPLAQHLQGTFCSAGEAHSTGEKECILIWPEEYTYHHAGTYD